MISSSFNMRDFGITQLPWLSHKLTRLRVPRHYQPLYRLENKDQTSTIDSIAPGTASTQTVTVDLVRFRYRSVYIPIQVRSNKM